MTDNYNINYSDTEHAHLRKSSGSISENYYISNHEHDALFAVDVTCDDHGGHFFIVYLGNRAPEYSPDIPLDHNEVRDFRATVGVSPKIALDRMIALHDRKVKTVRLVIWNEDDERTLIDFDRRLAETYFMICEDFTESDLTYSNVLENLQGIVHSSHFRFTSKTETNLTPHDQESLIFLLTDKMLMKFRELKYRS